MKEWRLRGVTTHDVVSSEMSTNGRTNGSEPSLRALVDQFPGVLWTTDPDLIITSLVGRGLANLGLGPNQLVGTNLGELFDTLPAVAAHRRALLGEAVSFPLRLGGHRYHARVAPLSDASGRTLGVIGMALDMARVETRVRYAEAVAAAG